MQVRTNTVDIDLSVSDDVDIDLAVDGNEIDLGILDPYTGEYIVTPTNFRQILDTARKYLKDNVTVERVPVSITQTPNTNGYTISIG